MKTLLTLAAMALALMLTLALAACDNSGLKPVASVNTSTITWVDATPSRCGNTTSTANATLAGCATHSPYTPDKNTCIVQMPKTSPDWMIAHELKHCFGWADTP